jgi:1-acyl-sn-glycerol-3-phosphate acyltransferase
MDLRDPRVHAKENLKNYKSFIKIKTLLANQVSIFIYPEGTFNETNNNLKSFFEGPFVIAIQNKTPIKPIVFLDNYERMNYNGLLTITPGPSRAVFLEEIPVSHLNLKDAGKLKEIAFAKMDEAMSKFKTKK